MEFGDRISELRAKKNLSQKALADDLGVAQKTVSYWEQGRNEPQISLVRTICNKYGVSLKWLVDGEGDMVEGNAIGATSSNLIQVPKMLIHAAAGAGNHIDGVDEFPIEGTLALDRSFFRTTPPKDLRAICVEGYSMVPMLLPGSWVVFDTVGRFRGDGLYVLNWRGELMVKLLQIDPTGKLHITSANKDYQSWTVDPDDQSVFVILGKVIRAVI